MAKKRVLHKKLVPFFNCKYFTVSDETYEVMFNAEYDMLVTLLVLVDL
ncbi:hypothetical protein [Polaribacter sp. L3A8]|nr:hypothetical protein [Polaribacter sp. L3A8]